MKLTLTFNGATNNYDITKESYEKIELVLALVGAKPLADKAETPKETPKGKEKAEPKAQTSTKGDEWTEEDRKKYRDIATTYDLLTKKKMVYKEARPIIYAYMGINTEKYGKKLTKKQFEAQIEAWKESKRAEGWKI